MTEQFNKTITRAPKGSLGQCKMVSYKMPLKMIDKIKRIAVTRKTNQSEVVRSAVDRIEG